MDSREIKSLLREAGVCKAGIAQVGAVDSAVADEYSRWIASGRHASMGYLEKYTDIRSNPELLLPGARSIISCAFNHYYGEQASPLEWATYALGDDYHEVVRERLSRVAARISEASGADCRVCVDTAPILERYWAVRAGVGFVGLNRQLIIPGAGSHFFLGEILTTLPLDYDSPCTESCGSCGLCIKACPGHALSDAGLDARRCLSYLTIEHRGELPEGTRLGRHVYGCDRCQQVCPHNAHAPLSEIEEFRPRTAILTLTTADILRMTRQEFSTIFRHSAIKRTKLAGLHRNTSRIEKERGGDLPSDKINYG